MTPGKTGNKDETQEADNTSDSTSVKKSKRPGDDVINYQGATLVTTDEDLKVLALIHFSAMAPISSLEALMHRDTPRRLKSLQEVRNLIFRGPTENELERAWDAYIVSETDKRVMQAERMAENEDFLGLTLSNSHSDIDDVEIDVAVDNESTNKLQMLLKEDKKNIQ